MEWIKIEKKWREMTLRIQMAPRRDVLERARLPVDAKLTTPVVAKDISVARPKADVANTPVATIRATA